MPGLRLPTYEMSTPTFHPFRTNEVWIGSCAGPMVSRDGGRTWSSRYGAACGLPELADGQYSGAWVDPDDRRKAFVINGASRYVTEDGGDSWCREVLEQSGEFAVDPTNPARFYVKKRRRRI